MFVSVLSGGAPHGHMTEERRRKRWAKMTKYCRAPNCSNSAGRPDRRRLSFYKFPLRNTERLQQWLLQMNQEKWLPTKHQHLCSEHFAPSCFQYRWGVRYLKPDAVPTIFQKSHGPLKRESSAKPPSKIPVKRPLLECQAERTTLNPQTVIHQEPNAFETPAFAIEPDVSNVPIDVETLSAASDLDLPALSGPLVEALNLVPLVQIMEPFKATMLTLTSSTEAVPGHPFSDAEEQQVTGFTASLPPPILEAMPSSSLGVSGQFCPEVAMPCKVVAAEATGRPPLRALLAGHPAEAEQGALIFENVFIESFCEAGSSAAAIVSSLQEEEEEKESSTTEMVAYFESIPIAPLVATAAAATASNATPPEIVLSSALRLPIVSTVPIISTLASPEASLAEQEEEGEEEQLEELSSAESSEEQLEEHGYHMDRGTTADLVEVVMGLQKKVKVLQQRHRRHCAKLEAMEGVVEQLRKENLVSEEKLKLLEMACLQSSAILPEGGDGSSSSSSSSSTVAFICQESDQALVYAVPQIPEEANATIIHVEEQ